MSDTLNGLELADFKLECKVGDGGLAEVYRATQTRPNRAVAIKLLRRHQFVSLDEMRDVLRREGEITAALGSEPAVVTVYRYDTTVLSDGSEAAWIALEWIDGPTLKQECERHPERWDLQYRALLDDLTPVFRVLGAGHERGVVHCDISPSNLMFDARGRARLLDLGAAMTFTPEQLALPLDRTEHTSRARFANQSWCAPEQRCEERRVPAPSTDVYSLAKVIVYALTGERLASRETPQSVEMDLGPWTAVLTRAMAWRQSDRYPDANVFFRALDGALREAPEVAPSSHAAPVVRREGGASEPSRGAGLGATRLRWSRGLVVALALLLALATGARSTAVGARSVNGAAHRTPALPVSVPIVTHSLVEVPSGRAREGVPPPLAIEPPRREESRTLTASLRPRSRSMTTVHREVARRPPVSQGAPVTAVVEVAPHSAQDAPDAGGVVSAALPTVDESAASTPRQPEGSQRAESVGGLRRDAMTRYWQTHPQDDSR